MALDNNPAASAGPFPPKRKLSFRLHRRRSLPSVRLGGERPGRGTRLMKSVWRRMRLRWQKIRYHTMLKRLRVYYRKMIAEIIEASASVEMFQQRLLMEATCAVPVMAGASFPSFQSASRPMSVFI